MLRGKMGESFRGHVTDAVPALLQARRPWFQRFPPRRHFVSQRTARLPPDASRGGPDGLGIPRPQQTGPSHLFSGFEIFPETPEHMHPPADL